MKRTLTTALSATLLAIAFSVQAQSPTPTPTPAPKPAPAAAPAPAPTTEPAPATATATAPAAAPAPAESTGPNIPFPFDLEIGYRFLDLKGSEDIYRTQINERSGLTIRSFTMATSDNNDSAFVDRFRLDVSDLGVGPASSVRLEADRSHAYRLRMTYRSTNAFSALPAFANPLLDQGIVPGQHTYERTRSLFDMDLELMPDRPIVPFVGFTWNDNHGPGQTTYHLGQDEFLLNQNLKEHDREIRAGASFHYGPVSGQLTEGWRNFQGNNVLTLASGAGAGNNSLPILGNPISAAAISRTDSTHVKTPFTNFYITGQVMKQLRLIGNYTRFSADSNGGENESAAGSFVSFPISRFFNGLTESASSSAKNTTWRGGGRAEVTLYPNVDFIAGYQKEHRQLEGEALIDTIFLQTLTFSGFDPRNVENILQTSGSITRNETVTNAVVSARAMGPFALRGEYRESKQDVNVSPDLAEIVVPGNQSGDFTRRIHTLDASGTYTQSGLMLGAAYRKDSANQPIFRTDFQDRDRVRVRGSWTSAKNIFRIGATAERTNQSNDVPTTGYDATMRQYSGDAELRPVAWLGLHGSVSQFRADSNITIRRPENFTTEQSIQQENGKSHEGGVSVQHGPMSLDVNLGRFENSGTTPFDMNRFRLRITYELKWKTGLAAEWNRDKYDEAAPSFGNFEATRYGIYLRWHP